MADLIDENVIQRIQDIYASSPPSEQAILRQVLEEVAIHGESQTYRDIWLADFKEVPVSIDRFISDPYYMGRVNRNGEAVYPFWKHTIRDIFEHGNQYNEIALSGATRIGKTSTAIIILAYMLYKLMLYRNPHEYFQKKEVSKFTVGFANLTKELAAGVAFREFNDTLKECPWFMDRGKISRSDKNFYYVPEGDKIEIIAGSDSAHFLGKQCWCLSGDTQIVTADGVKTLQSCAGSYQDIVQLTDDGLQYTSAYVAQTATVDTLIEIELEDGSIIRGTPDHKVMLTNGSYKALGDLSSSDDLLTFNTYMEVDEMNLKSYNNRFQVYVHTSPKGKKYIGITSKSTTERWGVDGKGYQSNEHFWNAIQKYGWDNFNHEIVAKDLSLHDACELESRLIADYDTMNPDRGYNHTTGGNWSTPDAATREKLSKAIRQNRIDHPEIGQKISNSLKGHVVSAETRKKISEGNKNKVMSEEFCQKQRARKHTPETIAKLRGHSSWCKGLTKDTDERLRALSESRKGVPLSDAAKEKLSQSQKARFASGFDPVWITDGQVEIQIQRGSAPPDGFHFGRLNILDTYIHKGVVSKKIPRSDLSSYLSDGWELGRPASVKQTIRKRLQRMHWEFDGQRFESAEELANFLRSHGYPKIVDSTISSLAIKGFDKSPTYSSLAGRVVRVDHENQIN